MEYKTGYKTGRKTGDKLAVESYLPRPVIINDSKLLANLRSESITEF